MIRRTTFVFGLIGVGTGLLGLEMLHAGFAGYADAGLASSAQLVRAAGLTDLALFTEARYTRNPALADLHTGFQDNPMSFDHFPSGTFAPLPAAGWGRGALWFEGEEISR